MEVAEFLQAYPRDLPSGRVYNGPIEEVQMAQLYAYSYGHIAYDALSGQRDGLADRLSQLQDFEDRMNFDQVEAAILSAPGGWNYRNEINFFGLNEHMGKMWQPLVHGRWESNDARKHAAHFSMNGLALAGLTYYSHRESWLREYPDMADELFQDPFYRRYAGAVQEFDAAIALLNWAKGDRDHHRNLTVVPAPPQFEHSSTGANADLLVIDHAKDRTVGVQVKTTVDDKTRKRYDPDRIVVVGSEDLGNVRVLPRQGKKHERPSPWPGIIAASRVDAIQLHGRHVDISTAFIPYLTRRKMEARAQLGANRADFNEASAEIGRRVLEKM